MTIDQSQKKPAADGTSVKKEQSKGLDFLQKPALLNVGCGLACNKAPSRFVRRGRTSHCS